MRIDWARLQAVALEEVEATLAALPAPLRERAQALPVTFERVPNAAHRRDGIEPDTLGLFVGPEFAYEETTALPLPPQIILFLENIWELGEAEEDYFREEVRTTYLHELGTTSGWMRTICSSAGWNKTVEPGRPERDYASTNYAGSFEPAAAFGLRVRDEARRRGPGRARKVVFIGDGAASALKSNRWDEWLGPPP